MRALVWFRGKELRTTDHDPLFRAAELGEVAALFVLDPYFFAPERARELPHRMQYLLEALRELESNLRKLGLRLLVVSGKSHVVVPRVAQLLKVDRVLCQRWTEPFGRKRDQLIQEALDVPLELVCGETLVRPGSLRSTSGRPYVTYTPFAQALRASLDATAPRQEPARIKPLPIPDALATQPIPSLEDLGIERNPRLLSAGAAAATLRLEDFAARKLAGYANERDQMARSATSRLSADLKFGTLSARQVHARMTQEPSDDATKFLSELFWREFTHSTLWDFPWLLERSFRKEFDQVPWSMDQDHLEAFRLGQTGYPIVDAAARQLLAEGYVENRARMIAASFLTKHLMLPYSWGEAHYMKYLVDGDWAQNNFGWQWSAGSGVGAQPYFRVMNPMTQARKFDPEGAYVRRYVPELADLPAELLFEPWTIPTLELVARGVVLGKTYPRPIVDHREARQRYLSTLKRTLGASPG